MLDRLRLGRDRSSATDVLCLRRRGEEDEEVVGAASTSLRGREGASSLVARVDVGAVTLLLAAFGVSTAAWFCCSDAICVLDPRFLSDAFGVVGSTLLAVCSATL